MTSPMSSPLKAPRAMSSKLLTMKFMQRAAASSPTFKSSTPDPDSPGDRSKRKFSEVESLMDQRAVEIALAAEETKRQAALERQAADAGDTRWALKFSSDATRLDGRVKPTLRVIQAGFSAIDNALPREMSENQHEGWVSDGAKITGRRRFGRFTRNSGKSHDQDGNVSSDSSSDDDKHSEDDFWTSDIDNQTGVLIKSAQEQVAKSSNAERRLRREAKKAKLSQPTVNKKKEVKLSRLSSISNGGKESKVCFQCNQQGHVKSECHERMRDEDRDDHCPRKIHKSR